MGLKPKTVACITAGVALTACVGYVLYFDYQRRNNPVLRKKMSKCRPWSTDPSVFLQGK